MPVEKVAGQQLTRSRHLELASTPPGPAAAAFAFLGLRHDNCCYLLRHTARDSRAAATEGRRLIGIVVPSDVDHNRMAFDI
jgi:hypothetical protein